jgi:hypothetical protein
MSLLAAFSGIANNSCGQWSARTKWQQGRAILEQNL